MNEADEAVKGFLFTWWVFNLASYKYVRSVK